MKSVNKINQEFNLIPMRKRMFDALWYHNAHNFAKAIAKHHKISLAKVAGVISALSPGNEWENNKQEAHRLIQIYLTDKRYDVIKFRTYGNNVAKAIQILELSDSEFDLVRKIGDILLGKAGYKTQNFYYNILNPSDDLPVTIDRHMLKFLGEKSVKSRLHYGLMAKRIRKAANKIGLVPSELQAVLWEEQIRRNKEK